MANKGGYDNTSITVTVPAMGDFKVGGGTTGSGIDRIDDVTPNVWEEADGAGIGSGIDKTLGVNTGTTIEVTPNTLPAGLTARFAYSKDADGGNVNDKASGGAGGELGSGWDLTLEAGSDITGMEGLTLYAGMSEYDQAQNATSRNGDGQERVYGVKYAAGGFTVGYQISEEETGETATTKYENTYYSVTFNVNDDLSLGYNHVESDEKSTTPVTAEADSLQAAYTMGGATIRIAEVDVENQSYQTTAAYDTESTILSLGLAF
jgi:hypothetical protein